MRTQSVLFLFFLFFGLMLSAVFGSASAFANDLEDRTAVSQDSDPGKMVAEHEEKGTGDSGCWKGVILEKLYDLAATTTESIYEKITKGALAFIMTAFAVWLSFKVLGHVSSFAEENPAELWTEVLQKFFMCFACGLIASSPQTVFFILNLFVFPIYEALLEFSSAILATTADSAGSDLQEFKIFNVTIAGWGKEDSLYCKAPVGIKTATSAFPSGPKAMMSCMVCLLSKKLNLGFFVAFQTMKAPGLMPFFVGIFVFFSFLFVKLGFAFFLIDTIFKMAMMLIIFPLMLLALPFKATRSWMKKCFFQILNSAGYMLFITIFIAMAILAIKEVVLTYKEIFARDGASMKELSVPIVSLALLCFLLTSSTTIAQKTTSTLVGGDSSANFQKKLAGVAKSIIDNLTGRALSMMKKAKEMTKAKGGDGAGNSL